MPEKAARTSEETLDRALLFLLSVVDGLKKILYVITKRDIMELAIETSVKNHKKIANFNKVT